MGRFRMKKVTSLMLLILILLSLSACENKNGWYGDYYYDNNKKVKNEWRQYGDDWYYCGPQGEILKNTWIEDEYYVDESGKMLMNTFTPDGYFVGADGKYINKFELPRLITSFGYNDINRIDYLTFGHDPITNLPIEWYVLDRKNGEALLFSKNVIKQLPFHTSNVNVRYEQSFLYQWLNNDFYKTYFSNEEKNIIVKDKEIFLLTEYDINQYFGHIKKTVIDGPGGITTATVYPLLIKENKYWYNSAGAIIGPGGWRTGCIDKRGYVGNGGNVVTREEGVCPAMWVKYK